MDLKTGSSLFFCRGEKLTRRKCKLVSRASWDARQVATRGQQEPVQNVAAAVVLAQNGAFNKPQVPR